MMKKIIFGTGVLIILMIVFFLIFPRVQEDERTEDILVEPVVEEEEMPEENEQVFVPADWEEYRNEEMGFSVSHPSDMEVFENTGEGIRFVKLGPSQSRGTEVYDGIILTFNRVDFSEESLRQYVENVIASKDQDIYIEITEIEETKINDLSGYKFSESALGTFTNIYLQVSDDSAILVTYLLEDPENQGFEETLEMILDSLKVIN